MTNLRTRLAVLVTFAAFATASSAAETPEPKSSPPNPPATAPMPMDHGQMRGGMNPGGGGMAGMAGMHGMSDMSGMMDMMRSCQAMMKGSNEAGQMQMPKMPPGNEKAEFEMRAEILQKTGEIASKYAERIKVKP